GSGVTTATNTWQLALKHDDLRLSGGGSIDLSKLADSSIDGLISELQFAPTADASLVLDQPAGLKLGWSTPSSSPVAIELTPLKLSGGGKHFEAAGHLRWPQAGSLRVVATNIATADLAGLLADPLPPVAVRGIVLNATWDQGPLLFNAETDVVWQQRLAGAV
ncbi:MAG TPA: hypothetical protein DCY13_14730, partial [Verrucomicrobiales bacterium]|nr:hypothetical protein [Verrucomicrobiales bacterium]